ncbi:MAG: helix-turn-helix transcriptional regulator [Verrucomicrobia bacterium]|nr:helix-turn-helix transcriptional regulator [Verrucomicrobiota bacterium]
MPRPVSIQDDVILRAAREIFLAKGLDATTSEIAAKAGVSHGIIFKRFKTKQALFQSAMQEQSDWGQTIAELLNSGVGRNEVQTTLCEVGFVFVQKFLTLIPALMMSWSNKPEAVSDAEQAASVGKARAAQALKAVKTIAAYLEAESRLGRIRNMDFEVVAQAFVGALWHHSFLQVMLDGGKTGPSKGRRYVKQLVQSLWLGLEPESIPTRRGNH